MTTISTTSQPTTNSMLRRLIYSHPIVAYFVIAFTGTWAFLLPFALSRNENGLGLLPFTLPDIAFFAAFLFAAPAGPALASLSVTAITSGKAGVKQLLRRCVLWRVGVWWYLILVLVILGVLLLSGFTPASLTHLAAISELLPGKRGSVMGLYSVVMGIGQ